MTQMDNLDLINSSYLVTFLGDLPLPNNGKRHTWIGGKVVDFTFWSFLNGTKVEQQRLNSWPVISLGKSLC